MPAAAEIKFFFIFSFFGFTMVTGQSKTMKPPGKNKRCGIGKLP